MVFWLYIMHKSICFFVYIQCYIQYSPGLIVKLYAVGPVGKYLGLYYIVESGIAVGNLGDQSFILGTYSCKLFIYPVLQIFLIVSGIGGAVFFKIICQVHEITQRQLLVFQVTGIYDPNIPNTEIICCSHLFPDLGQI